ncbi:DUF1289 domain-containing protein [Litorivivens sp.]|uniref:DUF1289 domain-containing protein n=1 Tax=Litorivivens sp. TaxID=2020868 RepID=UPI00356B0336
MTEVVKSPCISVCALDEDDLCMGCYRTMQEITDWSEYPNEVKREVIVRAQQRMKRRYNIS